jgi:two-component system NtrC family response regulator
MDATATAGLENLIRGQSAAIRGLRAEIAAIARLPIRSLLVVGETGAGKDLVPRALLRCCPHLDARLEVFNCPAIPADHLESELFGTTRGAYPGAVDRAGAAERAAAGVLFLDEIAAMPLSHQGKLLRLLESQEARRLGASRGYCAPAAVVAATNEDLPALAEHGRFRADLYHRLVQDGVVRVPPLRERLEDLELLGGVFLAELPGAPRLSPDALHALRAHDWPGNVRELRAVLRSAARLAPGPALDAALVREALRRIRPAAAAPRAVPAEGALLDGSFHRATAGARRQLLVEALEAAGGNQTQAGLLLGLHEKRLGARPVACAPPVVLDLRARKLAHRKFRYWWDRVVVPAIAD